MAPPDAGADAAAVVVEGAAVGDVDACAADVAVVADVAEEDSDRAGADDDAVAVAVAVVVSLAESDESDDAAAAAAG